MKADDLFAATKPVVVPIDETPSNVVNNLLSGRRIFFDLETTGLSPFRSEIALIQMFEPESNTLLLGRVQEGWKPPEWVHKMFTRDREFVGHNVAAFDLHYLALAGLDWDRPKLFDTLIAETLVSTSGRRDVSKSLRSSVRRRTGLEIDKNIEHGGWRNNTLREDQIKYAALDVLSLPELYREQITRAEETNQLPALDMEMTVLPVFSNMSLNGLPICMASLEEYLRQQVVRTEKAEKLLVERLGNINFNSHPQLKKALAAAGMPMESTAKDTLIDQIQFDPESENAMLLQAILDWRAPHKRTEMYGSEQWQSDHIEPDGRIHARFWQVGADTTRVSSSDPNLQQVPKDGRWVFGNVPGYKIVSVDYSQIEVRIAADIANDAVLMELLTSDDVHSSIARQVFRTGANPPTPKQRKLAKAMVFTLLFGGSYKRFHEYARLNGSAMTIEEAMELFRAFFEAFQGLWIMRQKAYNLCRTRRVNTVTLPNRARRVLVGKKNSPSVILNTMVQGTAAVGMKLGLIEARRRGLDKYIGAVVHDEAVSCVPDNEAEDYAHEMQESLVVGMKHVVKQCAVKAEIARLKNPDGTPGELPNVWLA